MKILPFEKYVIRSSASLEELYASIDQSCDPWYFWYKYNGGSRPLYGKRVGNEFKVYRAIRSFNSFLPIAFGKINDNGNEVLVEVTLKMNLVVMIGLVVWSSIALFGAVTMTFDEGGESPFFLVGMVVFAYLFTQGSFWLEVPKIKKIVGNIVSECS